MHLQPGGVIGQQRVRGGMALVEAITGKLLHQVEDLVGLGLADAVGQRAGAEDLALLGHLLGLLLAHRAAQQVGAAQRIAAQDLRGLHHLFLVDEDAVGLGQHRLQQRVRVFDSLLAVLARAEGRDVLHWPGPEHRVQREQVLDARRPRLAQHALHAATFELEHRFGLAFGEQLVDPRVVQRQLVVVEVLVLRPARADEVLGLLQDGQRRQAQEVELHQTDGLDLVLRILAHRAGAAGLLVQRAEVGDLARRDQHAAGMHADVAHQALDAHRQRQQLGHLFLGSLALFQLGRFLARVDQSRIGLVGHALQGHLLARRCRHQLGDAVDMAVAHAEHAADVAQRGLGGHGAEGGDLAHRIAAVLGLDVVDDALAVGLAEVDVEVGHRHAFGVQEALEQQVVLQRVQPGDEQRIGHQRACAGAAPRPHRAAVGQRPLDEVADDQEVAREAHLQDRDDLEFQPLGIARTLPLALGRVRVEHLQPLLQPFEGQLAEVVFQRHALGNGKVRQLRLAQGQLQVAALRDAQAVGQRRRHVGKQRLDLRLALEVLLGREALDAPRVGQRLALGDAHAGLVRLVVLGLQKLHRVRGHHRQLQLRRQRHRAPHVKLVRGQAGALQLQVEAAVETPRQAPRQRLRARVVAGQQRHADHAAVGARQRDQPAVQLVEPGPLDPGLGALRVEGPAARQQLAQVQVALHVLHQQQQPAGLLVAALGLHPQVHAEDRLDALAAAGLVELHRAEQVVQVGDGQRHLAVVARGTGGGVDAQHAVDDRELAVRAQVNEGHAGIVGSVAAALAPRMRRLSTPPNPAS